MKIGLALGGGGARALAHIGILKALEALKIKIDFIAGTSMGAIIGGLYSLRPEANHVEKAIKDNLNKYKKDVLVLKTYSATSLIEEKKIFLEKTFSFVKDLYLWNLRIVKPYLVNPKPFFRIFKDLFKNYTFRDCKIPFISCAVDILKGEVVSIKEGSLFKAITASSALPGIFPPLKVKDKILVDGGVLMPVPAYVLIKKANFIIGISVEERFQPPQNIKNALEMLFTADKIRYSKITKDNLKQVDFLLRPSVSSYTWGDFDVADEIIELGQKEMFAKKEELVKILNKTKLFSLFGIKRKRGIQEW